MAPRSASMSLKNGIAMASTVTTTTKRVLQTSLNIFILNFIFPMLTGYSLVTNAELGHFCPANVSTTRNMGWVITCPIVINYSVSEFELIVFVTYWNKLYLRQFRILFITQFHVIDIFNKKKEKKGRMSYFYSKI